MSDHVYKMIEIVGSSKLGVDDAIRNAISIGGDSDTVASIAGGVAEAMFGVPSDVAVRGWSYLPVDMREVLTALYRQSGVAA